MRAKGLPADSSLGKFQHAAGLVHRRADFHVADIPSPKRKKKERAEQNTPSILPSLPAREVTVPPKGGEKSGVCVCVCVCRGSPLLERERFPVLVSSLLTTPPLLAALALQTTGKDWALLSCWFCSLYSSGTQYPDLLSPQMSHAHLSFKTVHASASI